MAKNPLKKTKGLYVGEPQEKKKGVLKKVLGISAATIVAVGIFVGGYFIGNNQKDAGVITPPETEIVNPLPEEPETQKPTPGGEVQGGIPGTEVVLMEESQMLIASKIYTDLRADVEHDVTTIDILGTKLVTEGEETYLKAYISILEGEEGAKEKALYVIGYSDIEDVKDIPDAEVRKIKAGTVADIQKYVSIEKYIENETDVDKIKTYFENKDGVNDIEDLYVRVTNTNKKGNFVSTIDYVTNLSTGDLTAGQIVNEGTKYKVSQAELFDLVVNGEKTAETELER